jgi:murein DD-endopeptidase MepM/ murein hydrolase activator NlpD
MKPRSVTIVVHVDGDIDSKQYRLPLWAFTVGKWSALIVGLLLVLFFAFAGPITSAAARVPGLEREVAGLREENDRVKQLAAALNRAEANYQSLRQLLGGRLPRDTAAARAAGNMMEAPAIQAAPAGRRTYEAGPSAPSHWPLDVSGFVTRGRVGDDSAAGGAETHAGIDIAVPIGTPVRAAGGGTVEAAGTDRDYGLFVLLRQPNGYETMYGHASRLLVRDGETVSAGQVIALTGSSGRSTAPHLHFEVRREGQSLDPLAFVKEGH